MMAVDRPGVLGQITTILGARGISISSVLQHEPNSHGGLPGVPVIITTHQAQEGDVRQALAQVDALEGITGKTVCIGIADEHPEHL
jgi:homoserine dehydrogenase